MHIRTLAYILLLFEAVTAFYFLKTLYIQVWLRKLPIQSKQTRHFRNLLLMFVAVLFATDFINISIDLLTLVHHTARPRTVAPISLLYTLSRSSALMIASYAIWRLYMVALDGVNIPQYVRAALKAKKSAVKTRVK
jgi:hypothetical protein